MGSGKSSVARALSTLSGYPVLDTDHEIERNEQKSIAQLFDEHGEDYFREKEHQLCTKLETLENHIIATGGGFALPEENQALLLKLGPLIYLKSTFKTVLERLKNTQNRPLAQSITTLETLYIERHPQYEKLATFSIHTDNLSVNDISEQIWAQYGND